MIYFEGDEKRKITEQEFKEMFGVDYSEYGKELGVKFGNAFCTYDPFNDEIYGILAPIVAASESEMWDQYDIACQEI